MMIKRLFICIALFTATAVASLHAATPTASSILAKVEHKMKAAPSLTATFTANQGSGTSKGSIIMCGDRFELSTPDISVWFDGKNQWSYLTSSGEVNLTEPTPDEISQVNPFAIISGLGKNFKARRLKAATGYEKIELTPTTDSDIASATLTVKTATSYPSEIVIKAKDGTVTSVMVTSVKEGAKLPDGRFRFSTKAHPGVPVIDLR